LYISTSMHGIYEGLDGHWKITVSDVSSLQANNQLAYLQNMKPACYQLTLIWSTMGQVYPLVAEWYSAYKVPPCFSQHPTVHCYVQGRTYSKATKQVCLHQIKKKCTAIIQYIQSHPVVAQQDLATRYMKLSQMFTHTHKWVPSQNETPQKPRHQLAVPLIYDDLSQHYQHLWVLRQI